MLRIANGWTHWAKIFCEHSWVAGRGVFRNSSREASIFFSFQRGGAGAQHPLGHENPLKSIDFTGPGGLSPNSPPPEYASELSVP